MLVPTQVALGTNPTTTPSSTGANAASSSITKDMAIYTVLVAIIAVGFFFFYNFAPRAEPPGDKGGKQAEQPEQTKKKTRPTL